MRLERITIGHLRRALEIYFSKAYRGAEKAPPPFEGDSDSPIEHVLEKFVDEAAKKQGGARCYSLRLGNARYPFMKLRLSEFLYRDEYFFTVDTHDQMFADQTDPELAQLKAWNREVKATIEAAWEGAGLPTTVNLRGIAECEPVAPAPRKGKRILVVDDDPGILDTIAWMLRLKGYDVDTATDGEEGLELADPKKHCLILSDVEMPRMTGIELRDALAQDPARAHIPVLLATAGAVELAARAAPGCFLVKPFHADALFRCIEELLPAAGGTPPAAQVHPA
jgi:CheY-like chemotaxis protein